MFLFFVVSLFLFLYGGAWGALVSREGILFLRDGDTF